MTSQEPCFKGEAPTIQLRWSRLRGGGSAVRIFVAVIVVCACKPKEPSPPAATVSSPRSTVPSPQSMQPPPQPKLNIRIRDLAFDGYVAYLSILAQKEDGSDLAWGLSLVRFTDGCLGDAAGPTILLDLDGKGRARPTGIVHPLSFHLYPAGESVPSYEEILTKASRIEIGGGEPLKTEDGIGHGEKIGNVKFDVHVRDGLISGETVLVDCGR